MNFDIILVNNASKEVKILQKCTNVSDNILYLEFENIDLNLPDGEYTYAVIYNNRDDVSYDIKNEVLASMVITSEGDVPLRLLRPLTGLLTIKNGDNKNPLFYNPNKTVFYYKG